jgi:tetratricopeptide (TPR) repeat protein
MQARSSITIGKVVHKEARLAMGESQQKLLEEAAGWFEEAQRFLASTDASADIAEVYKLQAQVLEDMGRPQEAIQYWRSGYTVMSQARK